MEYKYENKFHGSIGFINDDVEIFVIKENIFNRIFNPHFYLYNHKTDTFERIKFKDIETIDNNKDLVEFLNTVREYSLNREMYILSRTYYIDLITEWEINNNKKLTRRFILI